MGHVREKMERPLAREVWFRVQGEVVAAHLEAAGDSDGTGQLP